MPAPALAVLLGTRPEAIKLSPVIRALAAAGAPPLVVVTGQHDEMLQPILGDLGIVPAENLQVMAPAQGLASLSARVLEAADGLLARHRLDTVIVQGDTTSAVMAGLAAFYRGVRVAHVEAGLRTHVPRNPFPEEMNRRLLARVADVHFAPTEAARRHLLDEGVAESCVHLVGNTVVDALFDARDRLLPGLPPDEVTAPLLASGRRIVLVTAHRRESFGDDLRAIGEGVLRIAREFAGNVEIAYPLHLNPQRGRADARAAGRGTGSPPAAPAAVPAVPAPAPGVDAGRHGQRRRAGGSRRARQAVPGRPQGQRASRGGGRGGGRDRGNRRGAIADARPGGC